MAARFFPDAGEDQRAGDLVEGHQQRVELHAPVAVEAAHLRVGFLDQQQGLGEGAARCEVGDLPQALLRVAGERLHPGAERRQLAERGAEQHQQRFQFVGPAGGPAGAGRRLPQPFGEGGAGAGRDAAAHYRRDPLGFLGERQEPVAGQGQRAAQVAAGGRRRHRRLVRRIVVFLPEAGGEFGRGRRAEAPALAAGDDGG